MDFSKFLVGLDKCSSLPTGLAEALKTAAANKDVKLICSMILASNDVESNQEAEWLLHLITRKSRPSESKLIILN